jgi:hypothetical protein
MTHGSSPTTIQALLCPGGITAIAPDPPSASVLSSVLTFILLEDYYRCMWSFTAVRFYDRFDTFIPNSILVQNSSSNYDIFKIDKFYLAFFK